MSRAFVKGDDSDLPDSELPERPLGSAPNYVTKAGLQQLRQRYEELQAQHAAVKGEGRDFDKLKLHEIERDMRYFSARLESAILVDVASEPKDEVHFGATVATRSSAGDAQFTIVGEDEADVSQGKVSWQSPLAKALIGTRVGDRIQWSRPAGESELEIVDIRYAG